jgi:hypothetical protein
MWLNAEGGFAWTVAWTEKTRNENEILLGKLVRNIAFTKV